MGEGVGIEGARFLIYHSTDVTILMYHHEFLAFHTRPPALDLQSDLMTNLENLEEVK